MMRIISIKIIYGLCLLFGAFFSYVVFNAIIYNLINIKLPFPPSWDRSNIVAFGIIIGLPIISICIYKIRFNTFDKWVAIIFLSFWIATLLFIIHSVLFK